MLNNEVRFAGDKFFEDKALSTGTDAQVSEVFELGNTHGGIRVKAWMEGEASCAAGGNVAATLQVGDDKDSTASTDWANLVSGTATAVATVTGTGTDATTSYSVSGDILSVIPESEKKFMRLSVANSTGMTGSFSAVPEYVPR
jgi:hypothetical protein